MDRYGVGSIGTGHPSSKLAQAAPKEERPALEEIVAQLQHFHGQVVDINSNLCSIADRIFGSVPEATGKGDAEGPAHSRLAEIQRIFIHINSSLDYTRSAVSRLQSL